MRSYVEVYGELGISHVGQARRGQNLATNDGLTSRSLWFRVQGDDAHRAALAEASMITITIGANDWQGPCDWSNHAFCLAAGQKEVEANLTSILDEIKAIRHGAPTGSGSRTTTTGMSATRTLRPPGDWSRPKRMPRGSTRPMRRR